MTAGTLYKQCELTRPGRLGLGDERVISWLPAELARRGVSVRLRDGTEGDWSDAWTVEDVTEPALPAIVVRKGAGPARVREAREAAAGSR